MCRILNFRALFVNEKGVSFLFGRIYGIENLINHKIYIGQTTREIKIRFREHRSADSMIGKAIRKYGAKKFVAVMLEECETQEQLKECEIFWIKKLNCKAPNGYNLTDGGDGIINPSEEVRKKISESEKGKKVSIATRQKISSSHKGKKPSVEMRLTMSESQKARWAKRRAQQ